jgi:hypothetical protein
VRPCKRLSISANSVLVSSKVEKKQTEGWMDAEGQFLSGCQVETCWSQKLIKFCSDTGSEVSRSSKEGASFNHRNPLDVATAPMLPFISPPIVFNFKFFGYVVFKEDLPAFLEIV